MATWDDVRRIAMALPEATERTSRGSLQWRVKDKLFTWERPLRRPDLEALGDAAPDGPILGVRVEHLGAKEALLRSDPDVFFTTPHFDGYPSVLVRLDVIGLEDLEDVIVEAWLCRAPTRRAQAYLDALGPACGSAGEGTARVCARQTAPSDSRMLRRLTRRAPETGQKRSGSASTASLPANASRSACTRRTASTSALRIAALVRRSSSSHGPRKA